MRASKTLFTAILALIVGFILAQVITSCSAHERNLLPPRQTKVADVLTWEPIDPRLGTLMLTIPGKLCTPSRGVHKEVSNTWVVTVDSEVTCPVSPQAEAGQPITYYYKHTIKDPVRSSMRQALKAPGVANAQSNSTSIYLFDIVGGCDTCDGIPKFTTTADITEEIECYNLNGKQTPVVVDEEGNIVQNLSVPLGVATVTWMAQGGYGTPSITFTDPSPQLCSLTNIPGAQKVRCTINGAARDGNPHHYTVALSGCADAPSADYTLTPVADTSTPPGRVDKKGQPN
jgi:hypothetical protein